MQERFKCPRCDGWIDHYHCCNCPIFQEYVDAQHATDRFCAGVGNVIELQKKPTEYAKMAAEHMRLMDIERKLREACWEHKDRMWEEVQKKRNAPVYPNLLPYEHDDRISEAERTSRVHVTHVRYLPDKQVYLVKHTSTGKLYTINANNMFDACSKGTLTVYNP